jgi:hypothetical protein
LVREKVTSVNALIGKAFHALVEQVSQVEKTQRANSKSVIQTRGD